jgi:hypothetical protein
MIDLETRVRRTLAAVATHTDIPPVPSLDQPTIVDPVVGRRARRRRLARAAAVTAVVLSAIVGVAAAGGLLPRTFIDRLNWVPETSGPIADATVEWGGSIDGPPGRRFEVWVATGENGELCTTRVFVDDAVAVGATPPRIEDEGGRCSPAGAGDVFEGCGVGGSDGVYSYGCEAGPVARAELHLADGTVMPTVIAGGEVSGWFPWTPGTPGPTLFGYVRDGSLAGQFTIDPPWCAGGQNRCSGQP